MIIVDIEASGTNSEKHSILSIGAINFDNPSEYFYDECRMWEGSHVEPAALDVNGFTETELYDETKKTEAELIQAFIAWAVSNEDFTFGGINPIFDLGFLKAAAHRAGLNYPFGERSLDLHSILYFLHLQSGEPIPLHNNHTAINSDFIMNFVGLPSEPHPHNALNGALWETEALYRLLTGEPLFDQFQDYPVPLDPNVR